MQKEVTFVLIFSPLQGITNMSNLDQFINKLWQEVHIATSHLTAEDKEDIITTLQSKIESLPNDYTRIDTEELDELLNPRPYPYPYPRPYAYPRPYPCPNLTLVIGSMPFMLVTALTSHSHQYLDVSSQPPLHHYHYQYQYVPPSLALITI